MRTLLIVLFVAFAIPAIAQQERECCGKQSFDLGGGAYGCLLEAGFGWLTTTTTRDEGASQTVKANEKGLIQVAVLGTYGPSKQTTSKRITAVCKTFLPNVQQAMQGKRNNRIIVGLVWPRVENPGDFVSKERSDIAAQVAFTNAKCRGVQYVG